MSETRAAIERAVQTHPGLHFRGLARRLEIAPGQVQYHVRRLRSTGDVVAESVYGRTHYYPPEYDEWERTALALLRRETAGDVVAHVLVEEPVRPGDAADALGIARSTLEWHLDRLVEHGLVEKRRGARGRVRLAVPQRDRTVELLRDADPSLGERMVDRFTRLVDGLLDGPRDR
ncbi:winged helix-turn-helix transcriptional regulator [Halobacterium yunchengense]|uniref:winged helix-turn-helix transcriptional regulator n=1 Tax=Halobacterium yunchengense TaxID=3108497 RepID=UPI003008C536